MATDLYKRYGVSKEEVQEWAKERYPQFLKNDQVLAQLYIKDVKHTTVDVKQLEGVRGPVKRLKDMKPGEWGVVDLLVGLRIRESKYLACPECYKKLEEGSSVCKEHGEIVPKNVKSFTYVVGDDEEQITAMIPPKIQQNADLEGRMVRVNSIMREDGTLYITQLEELKPKKRVASSTDATEMTAPTPSKDVLSAEVSMLKEVMKMMPGKVGESELTKWHASMKAKTPIPELLEAAGFEINDGKVVAKATAPSTPAHAPEAEKVKKEKKKKVPQAEIDKLTQMIEIFGEVSNKDLVGWHKSQEIATPLDELLDASTGVKKVGDKIVKTPEVLANE